MVEHPEPRAGEADGYSEAAGGVILDGHLAPRRTMAHALDLLTNPGRPAGARQTGFRCLRTVIGAQIADDLPDEPRGRRGTWFQRGAGPSGQRPDLNWADFIGNDILALLRHDAVPEHGDWPPGLLDDLIACLRQAVRCSVRRRVRPGYTNPLAMSVEMCALAGEELGTPGYVAFAADRLDEWAEFTRSAGCFEEFNSNTYGGVTLPHLATLAEFVRDPEVRRKALTMERMYINHVIDFYHRPTGEMCMPRARAYRERFAGTLLHDFLCRALAARRPTAAFDPTCRPAPSNLPVCFHATEEQRDRFLAPLDRPREVRRFVEWIGRHPVGPAGAAPCLGGNRTRRREIVAWLHPEFCLGSVNDMDSWRQRRALGGYVRTPAGTAMVSWRPEIEVAGLETDELTRVWPAQMYFNLYAGQAGPTVLGAVGTVPVDRGWLCGSHWRQQVSGTIDGVTVDLGFDIEGAFCDQPPAVGEPWRVELGDCVLTVLLIGGTDVNPSVRRTEEGARITLLRREDVSIRWSNPPRLGLALLVNIAPRGQAPALEGSSWALDGTHLECSVTVDGRPWRLAAEPPKRDRFTDRAVSFSAGTITCPIR
jgi:hypothetical protein